MLTPDRELTIAHGTSDDVPSPPWFWSALLSVTLIAVVVRIVFVSVASFARIANDAKFFRTTAHNLVAGKGYGYPFPTNPNNAASTAAHPPLFSMVLSVFDLLGLDTVQEQRVALAVVASSAVVLIGLAGRRVSDPTVGIVAATVAALHPLWLQPVGSLMSESVYLVAIAGMLLVALRALDRPNGWRFVALGATIGAAALVRSEGLLLVILVGVPVAVMARLKWSSRFRVVGALLAGCLLVIAPWVVRNEVRLGTASLSTQNGLTLIGSYCGETFDPHSPYFGSFSGNCSVGTAAIFIKYVPPPNGARRWNEVSLDHQLTHSAQEFARHHLDQLPRQVVAREVSTWALTGRGFQQTLAVYGGRNATMEQFGGLIYWVLAALGIVGVVALARRSWRRLVVLLGPVVGVVIVVGLTYGDTRFRVLAEPSLALLAAIGGVALGHLVVDRPSGAHA